MDDIGIILKEKVNLLQNFFSGLPECVIRDVLSREDIAGDVQLASAALSLLFDVDQDNSFLNVQYAEYYSDLEWTEEESLNNEDDFTNAGECDEMYREKREELPSKVELVEEKEFLENSKGTKADEEEKLFHTSWSKSVEEQSSISVFSEKAEKMTEMDSSCPKKENENISILVSSNEISSVEQKETSSAVQDRHVTKTDVPSQAVLNLSSDEDVESWFESTYGNGDEGGVEKERKVRKVASSSCVPEHSKMDHQDARAVIHSETVDNNCSRAPFSRSESRDERRSFDITEATSIKRDTCMMQDKKPLILDMQENNTLELNCELNRKEQTEKRFFASKPCTAEPKIVEKSNSDELQPCSRKREPTQPFSKAEKSRGTRFVAIETDDASTKPKPRPKPRKPKRRKGRTNDLGRSVASNEDVSRTSENNRDLQGFVVHEPTGILVTGLSEKTTSDALSNYMELMTGEDVDNVTFIGSGKAFVDARVPSDFENLVTKVKSRTLEGMQLAVEQIKACDSILVSGLSPQATRDTVLLYFENVRRSGGGDVKYVVLDKNANSAIVCFEDAQVIDNVIDKEHLLENKQLSVKKYYPQLSPEITPSPLSDTVTPAAEDSTEIEINKKQEKRDVSPDRQHVDAEVDRDIMEFIMSSKYREGLEEKLSEFKAEFEWSHGSDSATIWKKADTGYVKKWANSCQTVCNDFLDKFEKFPVPLICLTTPVIREALPRLIKDLPLGRAICKQNPSIKGIEVVCLESEKDTVSETVKEFWKVIEKEEYRKTFKKGIEKDISRARLLLLAHIDFVGEMKKKHSELEMILDKEKRELYFEGPREQFTDSRIKYLHIMNSITEEPFPLQSSPIDGTFVSREPVTKYLKEKLAEGNINALFFVEDDGVKIVAANSTACEKAKTCLRQSMDQVSVSAQTGESDGLILESKKCKDLLKELKEDGLLQIHVKTSQCSIMLCGVTEAVTAAKTKLEAFVETERIWEKQWRRPCPRGLVRFLSDHFSEKLKEIEKKLKETLEGSPISIRPHKGNGTVFMRGTTEGLRQCQEHLDRICATISKETKEYSSPGLAKLLLGEQGLRNLKLIEMEKKVVIEISKSAKDGVINTEQDEVDDIEREVRSSVEAKKKSREEARQNSQDSQAAACVYDLCNFTTAEGLKVSWKYGDIAKETADVLVNSATSDLTQLTACGKAFAKVGGQAFLDECASQPKVNLGDIVCTSGSTLPAQYIIHAVCCHWDNSGGAAEQLLRQLIKKILSTCTNPLVTSLALPAIGTGKHGFPENVVFKVLREEIKLFSSTNNHLSQNGLQDVRVIVYKASAVTKRVQNVRHIPSYITPTVSSPRVVSFGCVRVSLHEGDITQQPATPVDAIINILPDNLQLLSGGGVCKAISNAGGQTIQQQLDAIGAPTPGSVVCTNAGTMPNGARFILHFIPVQADIVHIQKSIVDCLEQARSLKLTSVSISAIGTASFHISARDSTGLILNAVKTFSISKYPLDLHIVVFQKNMVADFEAVMQEQSKVVTSQTVNQTPVAAQRPKVSAVPRKRNVKFPRRSRTTLKTLNTGAAKEVVVLQLFASSQRDIDTSLEEIKKFIEEHSATKKIEHAKVFDVLVNHWSDVEDLARDHDVSITCTQSPSVAEIEGMVASVSDCKEKLLVLITEDVEEERKSNQVEFISKNVQWYFFQGNQSVLYDKELNALIEMAYMENKETLVVNKNGDRCEIDLLNNTEKNLKSGQVETITRKQMGDSSTEISIPSHWSQQPPSTVVQLDTLQPASSEYQQVLNHFTAKGGAVNQIVKIERVQNPGLYKAYLVKKESMKGEENEQQLFHGTNYVNIVPINANNFDRSFAGANGVAFGNGVYFARDASYSLRYAQVGQHNHNYRYMYVVKVLVGKLTTGRPGMKAPPPRNDPSNPGKLFDSLVNNSSDPSIFVIFNDHQCYPEYLITFT